MRHRLATLPPALASALSLPAAPVAHDQPPKNRSASKELHDLLDAECERGLCDHPNRASFIGDQRPASRPDPRDRAEGSHAHARRDDAGHRADEFQGQLRGVPRPPAHRPEIPLHRPAATVHGIRGDDQARRSTAVARTEFDIVNDIDRFDLRAFHDVVLGSAAVPLDVLSANVHGWIEQMLAAPATAAQ